MKGLSSFISKKPKALLGIEIGTSSVKVIELATANNRYELANYGVFNTLGEMNQLTSQSKTGSLRMVDHELAGILKDILAEAEIENRRAVMSIPVFSSFFTLMELPQIPMPEIVKSIPIQARQYIPIPISEVVLDWKIIPPDTKDVRKVSILLVAVPKEIVAKYSRIANLVGLGLEKLEVETFSAVRSTLGRDIGVSALLDIGSRNTNITITDRGYIVMSHNFDIAGDELTNAVMHGFNVSPEKAESLKREHGLSGKGGEAELTSIMTSVVNLIVSEAEKLFRSYSEKHKKKITKIVLAGGTANMPGLIEYFVDRFGIECVRANPFRFIYYPTVLRPMINEFAPSFAVSAGLALRGL